MFASQHAVIRSNMLLVYTIIGWFIKLCGFSALH